MCIKVKILILLMMQFVVYNVGQASEKILVERYIEWEHPVLKVFKKYNISLYKVIYSRDGKYPVFYVKLSSSDGIQPDKKAFYQVYLDTLKANSFFPFTFYDKSFKASFKVSWDKQKAKLNVDMDGEALNFD